MSTLFQVNIRFRRMNHNSPATMERQPAQTLAKPIGIYTSPPTLGGLAQGGQGEGGQRAEFV
jgi:hypothetical protein